MTDRLALPHRYRDQLEALLRQHVPGVEVWAYGSRVNGESHEGSDLDLALRGPGLEPLDGGFYDLLEAIEKSDIPILVQAHDWAMLPESFHREIERDYVVVQEGANRTMAREWRTITLDQLGQVITGKTPSSRRPEYFGGGIQFVTPTDFNGRRLIESTERYLTDKGENAVAGARIPSGAVMVSCIGSDMGKSAIASQACVTNQQINSIIVDSDNDPRFIYYNLSARREEIRSSAGGSAQPLLNKSAFGRLPILLSPLPEQRAIAHVLGTLDDKIELNRRMNETLEAMARALFQSWFVDFEPVRAKMDGRWRRGEPLPGLHAEYYDLFPNRLVDSELGEIPDGWKVQGLGKLVELAYGKALRAADRKGGPVPVYGSNGQVGWHDKGLVAGPGIVVGRKGNPGVVTWAHSDFFPIDTAFYVVPRGETGAMSFLFFALTSQELSSVSADSAVPGLNRNLAYMNRQLVPNQLIVDEFNDYVGAIFSRRHGLEEESRVLAAQRDVLLPRLVSGEVRVEEASTSLNTLAG